MKVRKDSEDMRGHNHETPAVAAGVISAYASEILACLQSFVSLPAGQIAVLLKLLGSVVSSLQHFGSVQYLLGLFDNHK